MYESPFSSSDSSTVLRAGMRYKRLVALGIALGLCAGLAFGLSRPETVTASTNLVLRDAAGVDASVAAAEQSGAYERFVRSQELFAISDEVLALVAGPLDRTVEDIRDRVDVSAVSAGESLEFTSEGDTEAAARDLLDRHVRAYQEARQQRIAGDTSVAGDVLEDAADRLGEEAQGQLDVAAVELAIAAEIYGDGVAFSDTVTVTEPNDLIRLGVPAVGGMLVATALALVLASMADDRDPLVNGSHSLIDRHGIGVRGTIPERLEQQRQAFDRLGADIEGALARRTGREAERAAMILTIGVDGDRDHAVSTLTETCRSLADSGLRVCIVDGSSDNKDLPDEVASERFDSTCLVDLRFYESSSGGIIDVVRAASDRHTLPEYVREPAFSSYIDALRSRFDVMFVDCPSLGDSTAALKLARFCDDALLIVPAGTRMRAVDNTVYALHQTNLNLGGYISTNEPVSRHAEHWWSR